MLYDEKEKPTLEDFKQAAKELVTSLEGKSIRQIENGQKCLGLIYFNLNNQDAEMAFMLGIFDWANRKAEDKILELIL